MKLQITATNVDGKVNAPPSKSYTHRALVLSALAHGDSIVRKALLSADTLATLKGMESLGAIINTEGDLCRVRGGKLKAPSKEMRLRKFRNDHSIIGWDSFPSSRYRNAYG